MTYAVIAVERAMKIQEVILRESGALSMAASGRHPGHASAQPAPVARPAAAVGV